MICFRDKEEAYEQYSSPDDKNIKRPAPEQKSISAGYYYGNGDVPCGELVDEPTNQGAKDRSKKWRSCVQHHRSLDLARYE